MATGETTEFENKSNDEEEGKSCDNYLLEFEQRAENLRKEYGQRLEIVESQLEQLKKELASKCEEEAEELEQCSRDGQGIKTDNWRPIAESSEQEMKKPELQRVVTDEKAASKTAAEVGEWKLKLKVLDKQNEELRDRISSLTKEGDQLKLFYDIEVAGIGTDRQHGTQSEELLQRCHGMKIWGLAIVDDHLYVDYDGGGGITVYRTDTYNVVRQLSVPTACSQTFVDMASCQRHRYLYVAEYLNCTMHRVKVMMAAEPRDEFTSWTVDSRPVGLSVNADCNVIVTCVDKIEIFTPNGNRIKTIDFGQQTEIICPWHTVELTADRFVICHGDTAGVGRTDPLHRVCIVDGNGDVLQSFGGGKGPGEDQLHNPMRLAVVNGFIFVVDHKNCRLVALSSTLRHIRTVVSGFSRWPRRICFDERTCRLYFDSNRREGSNYWHARVNVCSVGIANSSDEPDEREVCA